MAATAKTSQRLGAYRHVGGIHPETATLANSLAAVGVRAPHTGRPYSEAMLLGIGGGLGAGYILWEFKAHGVARVLVLGFASRWQYPLDYLKDLCARLGVAAIVRETGARPKAASELRIAIESGIPAIAWVDRASMPYLQLPETMRGHIGHLVAVCGLDGSDVLVDDLAGHPFRMTFEAFADARARIGSYKHRLLLLEPSSQPIDLAGAVMAGLRECVERLSLSSDSFSLPAIRKWARMMTDTRNAKGWPVVFADRHGLYGTLLSLYEGVKLDNNDPGALRGLYAAFLDEAQTVVNMPALAEVATRYRALADQWSDMAEAALPGHVASLHEAKILLVERQRLLIAHGDEALAATARLTERLSALRREHNREFPLDTAATSELFAELQQRLAAIYEQETATLAMLGDTIARA